MNKGLPKYLSAAVGNAAAEKIGNTEAFDHITELGLSNLLTYVWRTLKSAVKSKVHTLCFVSTEGYLLKNIADVIIHKYSLPITALYFYCPQQALSCAAFSLMSDEKKYDVLFQPHYGMSPYSIMSGTMLGDVQISNIYNDICFNKANEHTVLTALGRKRFVRRLIESKLFNSLMNEKSKALLANTEGYLLQEGINGGKNVAIVSMGYTAATQHNIALILQNAGVGELPRWYYYGLYSASGSQDGETDCFYFSASASLTARAKFNVHVMRNICSAPHKSIVGYAKKLGIYSPVFKSEDDNAMLPIVKAMQKAVVALTDKITDEIEFDDFNVKAAAKVMKAINLSLLYQPSREQAEEFFDFKYLRPYSEYFMSPLIPATAESKIVYSDVLREYSPRVRVRRHFYDKSIESSAPCLFWFGGTVALADLKHKNRFLRFALHWKIIQLLKKSS